MINSQDIDILARTLYGEARGEYAKTGLSSLIAVGNVIINRWHTPHKPFGKTLGAVCLKPWQFSCWNENDPNRKVIENVTEQETLFKLCKTVSERIALCHWPDLTNGANHYHSTSLDKTPQWAKGKKPIVTIGRHIFYKL